VGEVKSVVESLGEFEVDLASERVQACDILAGELRARAGNPEQFAQQFGAVVPLVGADRRPCSGPI